PAERKKIEKEGFTGAADVPVNPSFMWCARHPSILFAPRYSAVLSFSFSWARSPARYAMEESFQASILGLPSPSTYSFSVRYCSSELYPSTERISLKFSSDVAQ